MEEGISVEYLSYDRLRNQADEFLQRYHPAGTVPVPIDHIIDVQRRLNIVPMPGLLRSFDVDAFITSDMESMYVDEDVYRNHENRYRFSLAHEIAHAVLHQRIYGSFDYSDINGWKRMQAAIPEREYGWLEWQAYAFAGLVLVPLAAWHRQFADAAARAERAGVSLKGASDVALRMVAGAMAREFAVSTAVIERRLDKETLSR